MTVIPLHHPRPALAAPMSKADAIRRHPAGSALPALELPPVRPGQALEALLRGWDRIVDALTLGPDQLTEDTAEELVQNLAASLCHPDYQRGQLPLMLPQARAAIARHDAMRDGDADPHSIGCDNLASALTSTEVDVAWHLYPLISNEPAINACTDCIRLCQTVDTWQTRRGCTRHGRAV